MDRMPQFDPEIIRRRRRALILKKKREKRRRRIMTALAAGSLITVILIILLICSAFKHKDKVLTTTDAPDNTVADVEVDSSADAAVNTDSSGNNAATTEHNTTVYIDPGHGTIYSNNMSYPDGGAGDKTAYNELSGLHEADLTLVISLKLQKILQDKGYTVVMTRTATVNSVITLDDRVKMAENSKADVFVSIHANVYEGSSTINGTRVHYCSKQSAAAASLDFARAAAAAIDAVPGVSEAPVKVFDDEFYVVHHTTMPSILIETCYLTDKTDAAKAVTDEWQSNMAQTIADGIVNYIGEPKITRK